MLIFFEIPPEQGQFVQDDLRMVLTDEDREALIGGNEDAEMKLTKSAMGSRCCCGFSFMQMLMAICSLYYC